MNSSACLAIDLQSTPDNLALYLRPGDCKYRLLIFKTEITDFFIFCQEKPFGELFSKLRLKLAREFLILRNPTKSRIAVFALRPQ